MNNTKKFSNGLRSKHPRFLSETSLLAKRKVLINGLRSKHPRFLSETSLLAKRKVLINGLRSKHPRFLSETSLLAKRKVLIIIFLIFLGIFVFGIELILANPDVAYIRPNGFGPICFGVGIWGAEPGDKFCNLSPSLDDPIGRPDYFRSYVYDIQASTYYEENSCHAHLEDIHKDLRINKITVHIVARATSDPSPLKDTQIAAQLGINCVRYNGELKSLPHSRDWAHFTWDWNINPATNAPWTIDDINNLSAGIIRYRHVGMVNLTQLYVAVHSTSCPPAPYFYPNNKWDRVWCEWDKFAGGAGDFAGKLEDNPDETDIIFGKDEDWSNIWDSGVLVGGIQDDLIGFRSGRTIYFPDAGTYTFTLGSDDGARLWIDDDLEIDRWIDQAYSTSSKNVYLTAGNHRFRIDYYEYIWDARVSFNYIATVVSTEVDLNVTYIERTPRYYRYCLNYPNGIPTLCPGTENNKTWPNIGETITYTAHIINKKDGASPGFAYQWLVDNMVVHSGQSLSLSPNQETTIQYQTTWPSSSETIEFRVDPNNIIAETVETNNSLAIGSHDLTISIWAEQGIYNIFNNTLNLAGSYSFEDWIQAQFAKMNERFSQAQYPVSPNGILNRIRIDKVIIVEDLDGSDSPMNSDPNLYLIDGRWQFKDNDHGNAAGHGGAWQNYVNEFAHKIDWGLIHEIAHQLGVIDLYRMNLANDSENNMRVQVKDINNNVIPASQLPTQGWDQILFKYPGIMAGASTSPYNDDTYFSSHTAAAMNTHYNFRRGHFGEYLFDTPANNYLKILNASGGPLAGAQVALYQKDMHTEYIDNAPEITGITDA